MKRSTFLVSFFGRVQGVGFRMLVLKRARKLGLTGWVKNSSKFDLVEACFQGEREVVLKLVEELKSSNGFVRVNEVVVDEVLNSDEFNCFEIRY